MSNTQSNISKHINTPKYYQGRITIIPPKGDYLALTTHEYKSGLGAVLIRYDMETREIKGKKAIGKILVSNFIR